MFHADGGSKAAEEESAGFESAPRTAEHGKEVVVVGGEVEHRIADHHVGKGGREGRRSFQRFVPEVIGREAGGQRGGQLPHAFHGEGIAILREQIG